MNESITSENKKHARQKPPLNSGRVAGEILAGGGVVFPAALAVAVVRCILFPIASTDCFGGNVMETLFFFFNFLWMYGPASAVGVNHVLWVYGPASAVGVYLVGRIDKQTGSFLLTLGCGVLGGLVMLLMRPIVHAASRVLIVGVEQVIPWALWVLVSFIPPIFATLGFNLTRRYKEPLSS